MRICPAADSQGACVARRMERLSWATATGPWSRNLRAEKMRRMRPLAVGRRRRPGRPYLRGMETTLTAMLSSGGRAALAHIGDSRRAFAVVGSRDHRRAPDSNLVAGASARAGASHGTWTAGQDRSADMGLRDLQAGDRYLLCARRTQPGRRTTDRTFMYSLCAPYPPTRRPTGRRSRGPASVSRLTPYRWARALHAGQVGSRLRSPPKLGACRSAAIYRYRERPGGTSSAAFLPDAPGLYWRTIAVTICPGKSGHK